MYSTCLYCTRDLETNKVLETLPIGRRVAFDAGRGRLWVVCRRCTKWNLVPFDTRLESIDACERLYSETATRFATDNIGIARVKEGLELVRIGEPLRPEFAAWRYGDSFGRRRRRNILIAASVGTAGVALVSGAAALGVGLGALWHLPHAYNSMVKDRKPVVRVPRADEEPLELSAAQCDNAKLVSAPLSVGGWGIKARMLETRRSVFNNKYRGPGGKRLITGPDAERLLAGILGRTNRWIGTQRQVAAAVSELEEVGSVERLMERGVNPIRTKGFGKDLTNLTATWRLAAEMALHEESEQAALSGELKLLEWQWREAERLAKISDRLALPEDADEQLQRAKETTADDLD